MILPSHRLFNSKKKKIIRIKNENDECMFMLTQRAQFTNVSSILFDFQFFKNGCIKYSSHVKTRKYLIIFIRSLASIKIFFSTIFFWLLPLYLSCFNLWSRLCSFQFYLIFFRFYFVSLCVAKNWFFFFILFWIW